MAAKDLEANTDNINSYLYEVFKLNPHYSEIYCSITSDKNPETLSMTDFMKRQYPKSPVMENLGKVLAPYIEAQELFAISKLKYTDALQKTAEADIIENLSPDERRDVNKAKDDLPKIIGDLKAHEETFKSYKKEIGEQLKEVVQKAASLEQQQHQQRREHVYKILDGLGKPRTLFKDKKIDNPLNFRSYDEAYDYMERQTSIDRTKIPVKNWQNAATDYVVFQKLIIYLALIDCLLPLGIDYGK
ncbi:MAG: hypothetical protein HON78_01325 [Legionellales bacterium]|jgi:hypothetical protein|nr:hypothetical protein [Legionellales bacterium]